MQSNDLWLQWPFLITACCHSLSPWKQHWCQLCAWWWGAGSAAGWGQEGRTCGTLKLQEFSCTSREYARIQFPPSHQAPRWRVIQRGTPEQMVSVPLSLSGNEIKWDEKHSNLEDNPPGSRRHQKEANCVQISLTQFLMEILQACEPISSATSFPSFWCTKAPRVICKIHPASPDLILFPSTLVFHSLFTFSCRYVP